MARGNRSLKLIPLRAITILAQSQPGSLGTGGNLIINTHQLLLQAGFVSAGSLGTSKGGNLTVNADDFVKLYLPVLTTP